MARLDELLLSCPGLCGEIARSINSANKYNQPGAALAGALSFVGTLKCGRVVSETGIEPNLYTCIIADSGTGKSQIQKSITEIIEASELEPLLLGKPASDAGLLKGLSVNPRRLLIWDEFGIALQELSKSHTGYRALILSLIMDLFSVAGKAYIGKEYATQARVDLRSPYLNIFAASTPTRFFGSLDESFVDDGFLSRWLVFFTGESRRNNPPQRINVTENIRAAIAYLDEWELTEAQGNLQHDEVEKKKITFESPQLYKNALKDFDEKTETAKDSLTRVFWSRSAELFTKVCMVVCETAHVTIDDLFFAADLVNYCIATQVEQCQLRLGENENIRMKNKVYELIKAGERLTSKQVHDRMRKLKLSETEKKQLIDTLVETEVWALEHYSVEGSRKKSKFYSLTAPVLPIAEESEDIPW